MFFFWLRAVLTQQLSWFILETSSLIYFSSRLMFYGTALVIIKRCKYSEHVGPPCFMASSTPSRFPTFIPFFFFALHFTDLSSFDVCSAFLSSFYFFSCSASFISTNPLLFTSCLSCCSSPRLINEDNTYYNLMFNGLE